MRYLLSLLLFIVPEIVFAQQSLDTLWVRVVRKLDGTTVKVLDTLEFSDGTKIWTATGIGGGISAATAAGMIGDSASARANDYLVLQDSVGNFKRPDTSWALVYVKSLIIAKVAYSDSNSWLPTWADINAKNYLTTETGDISNVGVTAPITGGGSSGSVTIGWDSTALNYTKAQVQEKVNYSDSLSWLMTKTRLDLALAGYLPLGGGTLTGTLTSRDIVPSAGLTYSLGTFASPFMYGYFGTTQAINADTIGGSTQTGAKSTYWENTLGYARFSYQSNGTITLYRYSYTGGAKTLFSLTTNGTIVNHAGTNNFDTLTVGYDHALTIGGYKAMTSQDSANARTYSDVRYQSKALGTAAEGKVYKYSVVAGAGYWGTDSLGTGGGASDGQNADSLNGKILDTLGRDLGPTKRTVVTFVTDSLKYKHIELAGFDSTGLSIGDSTACVLSVQANKIVITRQKNRSGSAAFTTTGTRVAVYIAGAKTTDRYFLQTYIGGTTPPSAVDTRMGAIAKTDSLVVYRPASGTSGQTFYWWRVP